MATPGIIDTTIVRPFRSNPKRILWVALAIFIVWLAFEIGLLPAITSLLCWGALWLLYSSFRTATKPSVNETKSESVEAFNINFEQMLSDSERYNLLWLAKAIALPISYKLERYYYDAQRKEFFYTVTSNANPFLKGVLNKFDLEYSDEIACDIDVRLELINDESSEIIEIPRLNAGEKVGIQLEFLSYMASGLVDNLLSGVEEQQDDNGFVLDTLLKQQPNTLSMMPFWEDFKLKVTFTFLSKFSQVIGIELNLLESQ